MRGKLAARALGFRGPIPLLAIFLMLIGAWAPSAISAGEGTSCGRTSVVRDFLAPFAKMAPIREVPSSGKLPFGPKGLKLHSWAGLLAGPGSAGFWFSDEAFEHQRNLQWRVESSLFRVNRTGKIRSKIATQNRRLTVVDVNDLRGFLFDPPESPGFYRVDIRISSLVSNRELGAYSEYVRVMRPRIDLRVKIERSTVAPGQTARARLANFGTVPVSSPSYVFGFTVRRFDGSQWVYVPENPPRGRVRKRMQILGPGQENRECLRYLVPMDQPPGEYRFQSGGLIAEFEVVAPAPQTRLGLAQPW